MGSVRLGFWLRVRWEDLFATGSRFFSMDLCGPSWSLGVLPGCRLGYVAARLMNSSKCLYRPSIPGSPQVTRL